MILRFRAAERRLHWAIAAPFVVCYATALVLVLVYNLHPERPLRSVFSWTHRISAFCLIVLPPLMVLRHRGDFDIHWQNVKEALWWTLNDLKWLVLMGPATVKKSITLPHQGKFNAAEKINFLSVLATYPIFVATGLTIWLSSGSFLAWLAHIAIALWSTPLMFGHIFMATVNPETRVGLSGMITGYVDRHWARHHYRLWYDRHFGSDEPGAAAGDHDASSAPVEHVVAGLSDPIESEPAVVAVGGTMAASAVAARGTPPAAAARVAASDTDPTRRHVEAAAAPLAPRVEESAEAAVPAAPLLQLPRAPRALRPGHDETAIRAEDVLASEPGLDSAMA